jgi:hypothetical protein
MVKDPRSNTPLRAVRQVTLNLQEQCARNKASADTRHPTLSDGVLKMHSTQVLVVARGAQGSGSLYHRVPSSQLTEHANTPSNPTRLLHDYRNSNRHQKPSLG